MNLLEYKRKKYKLTNAHGILLQKIEYKLDKLFKDLNIDITFTRHFKERFVQRKILPNEIIETFIKLHKKYSKQIVNDEYEALILDISNYLAIPFKVEWSKKDEEFELKNITIFKETDEKQSHKTKNVLKV